MNSSKSRQVLVIADNNLQNVNFLKSILASDYDLKVASNEEETMRLASSPDTPGLILLNTMMPTADIYEVCRKLKGKKNTRDIPIILLSEPTKEDIEAKGFEVGAADYITKPLKRSVVRTRIRNHLELKRYRENLENRVKKKVRDLHEEVHARRDIEDTYRTLVEHAREGIVIIHDFKVRFSNPAFSRITGFSEKELMGTHLKKFISEEEFIKNTSRYSNRIAGINSPRIYKSQIIHADGSTVDVELNICVVPYGRSLAALVFVRDIREEKVWY